MKQHNLDQIYKMASSSSKRIIKQCKNFSEEVVYKSDFYEKATFKKIVWSIAEVVISVAMFMFCDLAMEYILSFLYDLDLNYPLKYIHTCYNALAVLFLGDSVFVLIRILETLREKGTVKQVQAISVRLDEAITNELPKFDKQIKAAIEKGEDLTFEPIAYWQTEIDKHQDGFKSRQNGFRNTMKIVRTIIGIAAVAFAGWFAYPYIIGGFAMTYGKLSGYIVFSSYMIFSMVIASVLTNFSVWYHRISPIVAAVTFSMYQVLIVLNLSKTYHTFDRFMGAIKSKDTKQILENCIYNYPVLSLLFVTATVLLMILGTNFSLIKDARKKGVTIPMKRPAQDVKFSAEMVQNELVLRGIIATVLTMLTATWMVNIIEQGASFGRILLFLFIAVIWFGISLSLKSDTTKAIFNHFAKSLYLLHFVGYVIIVLSLTPSFSCGTLLLLGIHFLSLWVVAILLGILSLF